MQKLLRLIPGIIIFTLLPLAGYGFFSVDNFFSDASRTAFIVLTLCNTFFSAFFVPTEGQQIKSAKTLFPEGKLWFLQFQLMPLLNFIIVPMFDYFGWCTLPGSSALRLAGVAVTAAGFVLMNASVLSLGKLFTVNLTIQDGHRLVQSGVYSRIRHPRYIGILLMSLGLAFVFANTIGLAFTLVNLTNLMLRIGREEKMLANEFGTEWDEYRSRTHRLIPFIY